MRYRSMLDISEIDLLTQVNRLSHFMCTEMRLFFKHYYLGDN